MDNISIEIISRVARAFHGFMCIRMRKLHAECQIQAVIAAKLCRHLVF